MALPPIPVPPSTAWARANRERHRAYRRAWYKANAEKVKAAARKYRAEHPEKVAATKKACRQRHPETARKYQQGSKFKAAVRRWGSKNRDRLRAADQRYREAHPEKTSVRTAMRRSRTRTCDPRVVAIYKIAAWLRRRGDSAVVDHILPLSRGGQHVHTNLRILTSFENTSKGARLPNARELEVLELLRATE
jgi:5-methylcytosine-specific restriction endonuclease McrA